MDSFSFMRHMQGRSKITDSRNISKYNVDRARATKSFKFPSQQSQKINAYRLFIVYQLSYQKSSYEPNLQQPTDSIYYCVYFTAFTTPKSKQSKLPNLENSFEMVHSKCVVVPTRLTRRCGLQGCRRFYMLLYML